MAACLLSLPREDPRTGATRAVVETPRGARSKYDYDPELRAMRLKKVLPLGMAFPFDFGFIPRTKAEDGDPLDIMILMDEAAPSGCVVDVRIIGAFEAEQREKGEDWMRNDRILGVAVACQAYGGVAALSDLPSKILDELEAFFVQYNKLEGKELRVLRRIGPDEARETVERAARWPDLGASANI